MERSGAFEALVVAALQKAGYRIHSWDVPVEGFFVQPDIIARKEERTLVILVNASDSFFASQKKVWRNIEEVFEARLALGEEVLCVSIAFITPAAQNGIFKVSSRLFDASYLLCQRVSKWKKALAHVESKTFLETHASKRALAEHLCARKRKDPLVRETLKSLVHFFSQDIPERSTLSQLWSLEVERVSTLRERPPKIFYTSGHFERKGALRASLFGVHLLDEWGTLGLGTRQVLHLDSKKLSLDACEALAQRVDALAFHGILQKAKGLGGSIRIAHVQKEVIQAIRRNGMKRLRHSLEAMLQAHPNLHTYVEEACDLVLAQRMTMHFVELCKQEEGEWVNALVACSLSEVYAGLSSPRNWLLDLLLLASGQSQTKLSRKAKVGNISSLATGKNPLSKKLARRIVRATRPFIPEKNSVETLTYQLMSMRLYNLETHSYANPLYALIRSFLDELSEAHGKDRWSIFGYPEKNGAIVPSWHTLQGSGAGQIRVQFYVLDEVTGKELLIRVGSCHAGNVGNKRKEVAAKGRVLSYAKKDGLFVRCEHRLMLLVLDGEWEASSDAPLRHVEMLYEAGWNVILGVETIEMIKAIWCEHFLQ